MKRLFNQLSLFAVIGSVVLLTSCGDDDDGETLPNAPTMTVELASNSAGSISGNVITVNSGEKLIFDVDITAPGGFNTFRIERDGSVEFERTRNQLGLDLGTTVVPTISPEITYTAESDVEITLEFIAVDDVGTGQTAVETFTIEVIATPSVTIYEAFLLASPLGDGSSETFFSTTTGDKYSNSEVLGTGDDLSSEIDFGYYYGQTNKATLAGIDAYPTNIVDVDAWDNQNITLFRTTTMTGAEFDAITEFDSDDISAEYEVGTAEAGSKTNLSAGTVLAFKTDATKTGGSKFGLLKVVSIVGTDGQGDGINIEVKVNK
ncbi:hypothetical protein C900_03425 [Fulvivirga imtechensis AK7]|uniref:Uncharacterized protein n=1 Tax=Fulvivirga imtechensis AK7 TaxID=1237149 RepID=L8JU46_9BACT|nr:hypothetical protein [Fulvivirga imtechensis]ELR70817.1 hypothetical protein C900_03425 [Fulvivirga imtechensis AK7]